MLIHYLSLPHASTAVEFEVFAASLTAPRAQNVETLYLDLSPDFDLTRAFNLRMLSTD